MYRNSSWLITVLLLVSFHPAEAQPTKVARIGFVSARAKPTVVAPDTTAESFRQGLRSLGYIEGKNIVIDYRYFAGEVDRIPSLVAELLQAKLDVLVSVTTIAIQAFEEATGTTTMVIVINDTRG